MIRGHVRLTTAMCLLGLLSSCQLFQDNDYRKFVLIYTPGAITGMELPGATADGVALTTLFTAQGYTVYSRTGAQATRANFVADLTAVKAVIRNQDLFVFEFSGHGGYESSTSAYPGTEPVNGTPADEFIVFDDGGGGYELLYDDELAALLGPVPCFKKAVILDSCNSGGFIGQGASVDYVSPYYPNGNLDFFTVAGRAMSLYYNYQTASDIRPDRIMVIAAAGERDLSLETSGGGIFTTYFVQSRSNGDLNNDGAVTVGEAFYYAHYMTVHTAISGPALPFAPHLSGGPVDFVLFVK